MALRRLQGTVLGFSKHCAASPSHVIQSSLHGCLSLTQRQLPVSAVSASELQHPSGLCICPSCSNQRGVSSIVAAATLDASQSQVDSINDQFSEAREEISMAHDDAETTYFNESHAEAKQAVESALGMYDDLLSQLDEKERGKCQRAMGLKMEQLKAELAQLDSLHD